MIFRTMFSLVKNHLELRMFAFSSAQKETFITDEETCSFYKIHHVSTVAQKGQPQHWLWKDPFAFLSYT